MARSRMPFFVLLAAAAAAGVTIYVVKNREATAPIPATATDSVPQPTDETKAHVSLRDGRVTTPGAATAEITPEQMAARRVEADEKIRAALARMDADFRQQPAGTGLAAVQGRAQALLTDPLLAQAIARPSSADFECRARQCRLMAEFAPGAPPDDWITRLSTAGVSILPNAQVGRVRLPDGRTQVIAYFTGAQPSAARPYKGQRP